jgi:ketosteroid isomerase-like protein
MRTLFIGGALGALVVLVVGLSACGGSNGTSAADESLLRKADTYEISLIEKDFHEAMTKKDIDQMMKLWAPNATFTAGPGRTATGKANIRKTWLKSAAFKPEANWVSDHPAYKLRVTINGDRGTLHFECHFIDVKTGTVALVTAADQDVARIDGRWLITRMVGSTTELST